MSIESLCEKSRPRGIFIGNPRANKVARPWPWLGSSLAVGAGAGRASLPSRCLQLLLVHERRPLLECSCSRGFKPQARGLQSTGRPVARSTFGGRTCWGCVHGIDWACAFWAARELSFMGASLERMTRTGRQVLGPTSLVGLTESGNPEIEAARAEDGHRARPPRSNPRHKWTWTRGRGRVLSQAKPANSRRCGLQRV